MLARPLPPSYLFSINRFETLRMKRQVIVVGIVYIFTSSTNCFKALRMYKLLMRFLRNNLKIKNAIFSLIFLLGDETLNTSCIVCAQVPARDSDGQRFTSNDCG